MLKLLRSMGAKMATVEERVAALEKTQDDVVHILQTAGGQLQKIGEDKSLSGDELIAAIRVLLVDVGGNLKSIKRRGNGNN